MLKLSLKQFRLLAIGWLVVISILFFLPGSALPKQGWLDGIYFDKWVHFGFFAILVFLWRFYFSDTVKDNLQIITYAAIYAITVELIQHYFIPNRSFDLGDIIADMLGSGAGLLSWLRVYKKNRPL